MSIPHGVIQVGAHIVEDWVMGVRIKHNLPASYTRSDVMRFAVALTAGMDRYDSMREAESMGRRELRAKPQADGFTAVGVNLPETLITQAMESLGTTNRSYAVRAALANAAQLPDTTVADRGQSGRNHRVSSKPTTSPVALA